ncbi:MAG: RNA-binding transcriptional accessory protein, partial [Proteobacteria bacterium]|nr:RNA-binding transcriptional accessory protein [Pseudomonadota bacterium]
MLDRFIARIAAELNLPASKVSATARLLGESATVPFIARYRKEVTGSLDEVAITSIRDRLAQLTELEQRREAILSSLAERQLLTESLKASVEGADTLAALEDVYAPFRPKRRTRATIAKEAGLEPLADQLFNEQATVDPLAVAAVFVNAEKSVPDAAAALAGARDILAERFSEDTATRSRLRELYWESAQVRSKVMMGKQAEGAKF